MAFSFCSSPAKPVDPFIPFFVVDDRGIHAVLMLAHLKDNVVGLLVQGCIIWIGNDAVVFPL